LRGDGTVYRQKGSRFWWISYWAKDSTGKRTRRRESSNSESFDVARELLNQRRAGASFKAEEVRESTPETVTIAELVSDLLAWYLTENPKPEFHLETKRRWDKHLQPFFGALKANELGTAHLRAYRVKRSQQKAAFGTISRELQVLRKAYKLAADSEPPKILRVPKFKGAIGKEKNARKVFIDPVLAKKLKDAAAKEGLWVRVFLEMAFTFGWRKGELQGMLVENVRFAENIVRIEDSKNGEPREVPMTPELRILIQPLILGRNLKEKLFPKKFRHIWKRLCENAGVESGKKAGFIVHDIRRTSARSKRASGVSESVIMDIHGWKTSEMFRRYGIVNQADRVQALAQESHFVAEAQKTAAQTEQDGRPQDLSYMTRAKSGSA